MGPRPEQMPTDADLRNVITIQVAVNTVLLLTRSLKTGININKCDFNPARVMADSHHMSCTYHSRQSSPVLRVSRGAVIICPDSHLKPVVLITKNHKVV